jgi:type IV secretory pathway TrbF-like protein
MKRSIDRKELPEGLQYTKYYEHDGMLRAYANRAMVMAFVFAGIAVTSLAFAIYVRVQPPTVIRVDQDGVASAVGPANSEPTALDLHPFRTAEAAADNAAPTEIEARAVVRTFLEQYLAYTPSTVDQNMARALNMMTANLRAYTLGRLRDQDTVGKIKADRITSQLQIRTIEPVKDAAWTYVVFGVKEVRRLRDRVEATDRIVARYSIRLVQDRRSETNPSGLLVAEFSEQQMVGERDDDLLQQSRIAGDRQ